MNISGIDEASAIFSCQSEIKVIVHSISSPTLQIFTRNISLFLRSLGDDGTDEFWSPIVREVKRFGFDISAAPLSQKDVSVRAEALYNLLKSKVRQSKLAYSREQSETLSQLTEQANQMISISEHRLLDTLLHLINNKELSEIAIAICETRLIPEVEKTLIDLLGNPNVNVVSPANLKETT